MQKLEAILLAWSSLKEMIVVVLLDYGISAMKYVTGKYLYCLWLLVSHLELCWGVPCCMAAVLCCYPLLVSQGLALSKIKSKMMVFVRAQPTDYWLQGAGARLWSLLWALELENLRWTWIDTFTSYPRWGLCPVNFESNWPRKRSLRKYSWGHICVSMFCSTLLLLKSRIELTICLEIVAYPKSLNWTGTHLPDTMSSGVNEALSYLAD